jgi:hypothetical protein
MNDEHTTAVVQRYLEELGGDSPSEPIVRALLDRSVRRLHVLLWSTVSQALLSVFLKEPNPAWVGAHPEHPDYPDCV